MAKIEQGFILAATLWVLAFMAMGVAYFSKDTVAAIEKAHKQQQGIKTEVAMLNTQTTLLYLMMLEPVSEAGIKLNEETSVIPENSFSVPLNHLPLDGRSIEGFGNVIISIQDEAGLVPLNVDHPRTLTTLLRLIGVPSEDITGLIAKLLDYRDRDDLYRISGAEKMYYDRFNLSPPLNADLYTSGQAKKIAGWAKQQSLWVDSELLKNTNTVWNSFPNFNTAPKLVLQAMDGITAIDAESIIKRRRLQPFRGLGSIHSVLGKQTGLDPMSATFYPSKYYRISLWDKNGRQKKIIHVELMPFSTNDKPWRVNTQYCLIGTFSTLKP